MLLRVLLGGLLERVPSITAIAQHRCCAHVHTYQKLVRWDQVGWTKLHSYSHHATVHFDINVQSSVASKILEGFGEVLCKEFILGRKPVSTVHFTRPGTCINHPLHLAWIQYQAAHPKLISSTTPCKLACHLP